MKKALIALLIVLLGILSFVAYDLFSPVIPDENTTYYLRAGTSNKKFIADLQERGLIKRPHLFWAYVLLNPGQIKTGEYAFPKGASLIAIWRQVTGGFGLVNHAFTIVPGWTFAQLRDALNERENLKHVTLKDTDADIMQRLGSREHPEGLFFPETYHYTRGQGDIVILKRAYDLMQSRLRDAWRERDKQIPFKTPYEALIAASLIEKESGDDEERTLIASVLVNRLNKNMMLQFDPTVIYGMGKNYTGKIYKTDLQNANPYNTYLHKGLPPTPIAMSAMTAIEAAMHPKQTDYYYFVAKGDGTHQFSRNLVEHQAAVQKANEDRKNNFVNESFFKPHLLHKILTHLLLAEI